MKHANDWRMGREVHQHFHDRKFRDFNADFAFDPARGKTRVCASLASLCAHIHALRGRRPIELDNVRYKLTKDRTLRVVAVSIAAQAGGGQAEEFLGYAYLMGRDLHALKHALFAHEPTRAERPKAA